jgi:hypothetical protein
MGVTQSMGRVGSALDNAVIESWHSTLEFELRVLEHFATKAQARARVAAWIDDYNRDRKHSALDRRGRRHAQPDRLRTPPARQRTASAGGRSMNTAPSAMIIAPFSPASRPSRPGGLRPALTPAAGGAHRHQQEANREDQINKIRLTEVSTDRGDCRKCRCSTKPQSVDEVGCSVMSAAW